MAASQIDRFGNHNFACIGPHAKPTAQLLGMRGAPGNSISHTTSYWVANQSKTVFVDKVDIVSGVGYDRAAKLGPASTRGHDVRFVISNLAVYDFETPDHRMRLRLGPSRRQRRRGRGQHELRARDRGQGPGDARRRPTKSCA